jgi:hypothetical protein
VKSDFLAKSGQLSNFNLVKVAATGCISDLLDRLRFAHGAYNLVHIAVSDHCTLKRHSLRVRGFNPISGGT